MTKQDAITIKGVREIGAKKLVGFRVICDSMEEFGKEIPKASLELVRRKNEIHRLVEPVQLIGAFKPQETSEADDGYWVCFEVHDYEAIPKGMVTLTVPPQKYAILHFQGHASQIFGVYSHLHQWIESNDHQRKPSNWTLEIYSSWSEAEDQVDLSRM
ncbi:Predicted transcriptional regulator YdeE, contains AraC-type DNA-binding domain [Oceanobacillus limi]|uniref:Predicted transcriptional regulator YdeE, contains AraC-type DNA-binding domain n=1 Tax=Oceanobacillus limi TaxID=930131 RepID=A0A1I0FZQ2_9BACI|nr:GyrI-like domain-containing protein [Oceanobacillus limi]SET63882.1 Predicted transcriptional regulator YdeE, contains AraC-type DNA-binding domain [Oceanobacillus limi]